MSLFVIYLLPVMLCQPVPSPKALADEEAKAGFVVLFNGRDFSGWKEVQGSPGSFSIKEGEIAGTRDGKKTAYWLSTDEKYGDFDLRLKVKLPPGGNSGVFIRVPGYTGRTSKEGMEIQLQDDGSKLKEPNLTSTGAIYQAAAAKARALKVDDWNAVEIRCEGEHIQVWINGMEVNDVHADAIEVLKKRPKEGFIGLSAHTKEVRFRNIRIRELPKA